MPVALQTAGYDRREPRELQRGEIVNVDSIGVLITRKAGPTFLPGVYSAQGTVIDSPWLYGIGALGGPWTIHGNELRRCSVRVYGPITRETYNRIADAIGEPPI